MCGATGALSRETFPKDSLGLDIGGSSLTELLFSGEGPQGPPGGAGGSAGVPRWLGSAGDPLEASPGATSRQNGRGPPGTTRGKRPVGGATEPGGSRARSPLPSSYVSPMGNHANRPYHQVPGPSLGAPGLSPPSPPSRSPLWRTMRTGCTTRSPAQAWELRGSVPPPLLLCLPDGEPPALAIPPGPWTWWYNPGTWEYVGLRKISRKLAVPPGPQREPGSSRLSPLSPPALVKSSRTS